MMNRRQFFKASAGASLYPFLPACDQQVRWEKEAFIKPKHSQVAILAAGQYGGSLHDTVRRGIDLFRLDPKGKRILLKPNLVAFDPNSAINTHPAVIEAAIDSFRSLGAREVLVAEGPGHRRDTEYLITASGIY